MDNVYKIAIASSDGIVVNRHFGHAETFYIYEVRDGTGIRTEEIRKVQAVCHSGDHDDDQLTENIRRFQDCKYILVSKIGARAAAETERLGIIPVELPGIIEDSVKKLISFEEIHQLFERN